MMTHILHHHIHITSLIRNIYLRQTTSVDLRLLHCSQLMAMITWTKKKFKQIYQYRTKGTYCDYMGDYRKIKKQHSFRRQQLACSAQSAQMAGYFSLSTTGPSKGVLFFNFFMVSHVATICTFGPILVDLLELFFGPNNHCHEL